MEKRGLEPDEVLMFGNNEKEDGLPTKNLGMKAFMVGNFIVEDESLNGEFEHLTFEDAIKKIDSLIG